MKKRAAPGAKSSSAHCWSKCWRPTSMQETWPSCQKSSARVDFAVRFPGNLVNADGSGTQPLWLPIDAKFPREDYARLIDAQERADQAALDLASAALEARVRACAK